MHGVLRDRQPGREILVAQTDLGRGIVGVVDGMPPAGIETPSDEADRKRLLREIGYKL